MARRQELAERRNEIATNLAADATVIDFDHGLCGRQRELAVDAGLAELVDDHRDAAGAGRSKDVVEQRRLPGPEKSREDRGRNGLHDDLECSWRGRSLPSRLRGRVEARTGLCVVSQEASEAGCSITRITGPLSVFALQHLVRVTSTR